MRDRMSHATSIYKFSQKLFLAGVVCSMFSGCSNMPTWGGLTENDFATLEEVSQKTQMSPQSVSELMASNSIDTEYRVHAFDELAINVWGRPDLGSQIIESKNSQRRITIVNKNGMVSLPFVAPISVSGLMVSQVVEAVRKAYSSHIEAPEITVQIAAFRSQSVYVEGAVSKPGKVYLSNDIYTLGDVVNKASVSLAAADITEAELIRDGKKYSFNYHDIMTNSDGLHALPMKDGDRIYFPLLKNRNVYVFGEVQRPRKITIPPAGISLTEVLATVYGPDVITGDVGDIYFIRPYNNDDQKLFKVGLNEILEGPEIAMQPMDRIYVAPTALAVWDRTWRQILPFFTVGGQSSNIYQVVQEE